VGKRCIEANGTTGAYFVLRLRFLLQVFEKAYSGDSEFPLQAFGAVAVFASPRFRAVIIPTLSTVVGVLNLSEREESLPIGTLFLKRSGAIAYFDPAGGLVLAETCVPHIAKILTLGD